MNIIRNTAAIAATVVTIGAASAGIAHADNSQMLPLEINPVCAQGSLAYWNVYNKNADNVVINWTAIDNGNTGTFNAPAGHSQFASFYNASDPNNTTRFDNAIDTSAPQRNSSNTACQPGDITVAAPTTGGNGSTGNTSSNTGSTGQVLGASTVVASVAPAAKTVSTAPAAKQLADTGASRILPLIAAALVAAFTATTSVLVRKNVL